MLVLKDSHRAHVMETRKYQDKQTGETKEYQHKRYLDEAFTIDDDILDKLLQDKDVALAWAKRHKIEVRAGWTHEQLIIAVKNLFQRVESIKIVGGRWHSNKTLLGFDEARMNDDDVYV